MALNLMKNFWRYTALLALLTAGPAFAQYLALGDSIAYGFNSFSPATPVPSYAFLLGQKRGLSVINAGCPFETSASFVSAAAPDFGCLTFKNNRALFVNYSGTQLDFAVSYLKLNPKTKLVTLNIGGNDLAAVQFACGGDTTCIGQKLPATLLAYSQNLTTILQRIRGDAGYRGPIIILTYYAFNYLDLSQATLTVTFQALNTTAALTSLPYNVQIADGFLAFFQASSSQQGDTCAAGLRIPGPPNPQLPFLGPCDVHPSDKGHQVLEAALAAVTK